MKEIIGAMKNGINTLLSSNKLILSSSEKFFLDFLKF